MTNKNGVTAKIMEFGALLVSLEVPDRDGKLANITVGYDSFQNYSRGTVRGATVGRYANRISNAKFTLDGIEYKIAANAGIHHIHGGRDKSFNKVLWEGEEFQNNDEVGVKFIYLSKDGDEGFPGNLKCAVTYTLTNNDEMKIHYEAITDKPTVVNMTNHSYFNLAGPDSKSVMDHEIFINADNYTPAGDSLIPTGEIASVKGTPLDFTRPMAIGSRIAELKPMRGYDHNYVINDWDNSLKLAARVNEPGTGRVMEVLTTEPGVQFYTSRGEAYCLETEHYPDSPNKPQFPSVVLRPGEIYRSTTVFKFSTK